MQKSTGSTTPAFLDDIYEVRDSKDINEVKSAAQIESPFWRINLWGSVQGAVNFANAAPISQPGTIAFVLRSNDQCWTIDFR